MNTEETEAIKTGQKGFNIFFIFFILIKTFNQKMQNYINTVLLLTIRSLQMLNIPFPVCCPG